VELDPCIIGAARAALSRHPHRPSMDLLALVTHVTRGVGGGDAVASSASAPDGSVRLLLSPLSSDPRAGSREHASSLGGSQRGCPLHGAVPLPPSVPFHVIPFWTDRPAPAPARVMANDAFLCNTCAGDGSHSLVACCLESDSAMASKVRRLPYDPTHRGREPLPGAHVAYTQHLDVIPIVN